MATPTTGSRLDPVPLEGAPRRSGRPCLALHRCRRGRSQPRPGTRRVYLHARAGRHPADSPRFLGFIPAAPTKASLLFDMVMSCASCRALLAGGGRCDVGREPDLAAAGRHGRASGLRRRMLCLRRKRRQPVRPGGGREAGQAPVGRTRRWSPPGRRERPGPLLDRQRPAGDRHGTARGPHRGSPADRCRPPGRVGDRSRAGILVAVAATAGTTNAGIVDDLAGIAEVAEESGCGCTSTPPMAGRRCSRRRPGPALPEWSGPTRLLSTRTSGCSPRSTAPR